jgi:hypothetical protein
MLSEAMIANQAFFAALPQAAREELTVTLGEIGRDVLEIQQSAVPVYTGPARKDVEAGLLKRSLTVAEAIESLRVRIGFPALQKGRSRLFYAIIQHYGRKAQTVQVTRGDNRQRGKWRVRMQDGRALAYRPTPARSYSMRVRAMAGTPFVHVEERADAAIDRRLADFWDKVTGRAEA